MGSKKEHLPPKGKVLTRRMFLSNNVIVALEIPLNNTLTPSIPPITKNVRRKVTNIIMNLIRDKSIINSGLSFNRSKWNPERFSQNPIDNKNVINAVITNILSDETPFPFVDIS